MICGYTFEVKSEKPQKKEIMKSRKKETKMLTMEEINQKNLENGEENTMYLVEHRFYRKGYNGDYIENTGDSVYGGYNDYDEAEAAFNYLCSIHSSDYAVIKLTQAYCFMDDYGTIDYDTVLEFDSRIREDIYRSLEYVFDNAYEKENSMYYLEQLPYTQNSDYDEDVHQYIDKLYNCIRNQDEDAYEDVKSELVDYYFRNQCNYKF